MESLLYVMIKWFSEFWSIDSKLRMIVVNIVYDIFYIGYFYIILKL